MIRVSNPNFSTKEIILIIDNKIQDTLITGLNLTMVLPVQPKVPALDDAPVVLSPRADPRSIQARATGGRLVEAPIRAISKVEASIGVTSKGRGILVRPRMVDLGHPTHGKAGHLKDKSTVKESKIEAYLDREVTVEAGVESPF